MTRRYLRFFIFFLPIQMVVSSAVSVSQAPPLETPDSAYDCDITEPNGLMPAGTPYSNPADWYGSGSADPSLWLYAVPNGPIIPYPDFEPRDEGGHRIKTPFWRSEGSGPIMLTGERLDAPSEHEPHIEGAWGGYPIPGMIATGIWYPTDGCWELTATDGNDTLTWTVLVRSPFASCPVTSAADDGDTAPDNVIPVAPDHYYGENGLYVTLGPPDRQVRNYPLDSGLVSKEGAIFDTFVWYRQGDAQGSLSITVENVSKFWLPDEPEINIPSGYGNSGVQASGITFPGPGCWQITGTSGNVSISFILRLEVVPAQDAR